MTVTAACTVEESTQESPQGPAIATVYAYSDFYYTGGKSLAQALHEREYWIKLSRSALHNPGLAGRISLWAE
jgi:hypothetical protein